MREAWATKSLGEVCEVIAGQSPAGTAYNSNGGGLPFYQGKKEFEEKYIGAPTTWTTEITKRAKVNDILMSVRAPVGPINFATQEVCIGRGLAAIRATAGLDQNFLFYFLLSIQSQISGRDGAVFPSISRGEICSIPLPVPSLSEQQRIVAILDEAFAGLAVATANAEKNRTNARELFESYLGMVFDEGDERWPVRRLEDLVEENCSLSYGIVQPGDEQSDGLPIVRPVDMTTKLIRLEGLKRIDASLADAYSRTSLRGGELLLCVRGTTGAVSVAADEVAGGNVTRGIVPIVFNSSQLTQRLGYYALKSEPVQRQIREKTYGAALMQINIRDVRNLLIPTPPLTEQGTLSAKLDSLSKNTLRLQEIYQSKLNDLKILRQSLLQKAFSGELTSPPSQAIKEAAE